MLSVKSTNFGDGLECPRRVWADDTESTNVLSAGGRTGPLGTRMSLAALTRSIQLASVPRSLGVTKFPLCSCPSGVCHDLCHDLCHWNPRRNIGHHVCVFAHTHTHTHRVVAILKTAIFSFYTVQASVFWFPFSQRVCECVCVCVCVVSSPQCILGLLLNSHMRVTQGFWFHCKIRLTSIESQVSPCGHAAHRALCERTDTPRRACSPLLWVCLSLSMCHRARLSFVVYFLCESSST